MSEERVAELVEQGRSLQQIADELGEPRWAVRRFVLQAGLETAQMRSRRLNREARAVDATTLIKECPQHGVTEHRTDGRGGFRCPRCNVERVLARRRSVKETLIDEAGGLCALCGYDRCVRALHFHHLDRGDKAFGLATRGVSRALAKARAEAEKCVLLCANCHMEVEHGVATVPEI